MNFLIEKLLFFFFGSKFSDVSLTNTFWNLCFNSRLAANNQPTKMYLIYTQTEATKN